MMSAKRHYDNKSQGGPTSILSIVKRKSYFQLNFLIITKVWVCACAFLSGALFFLSVVQGLTQGRMLCIFDSLIFQNFTLPYESFHSLQRNSFTRVVVRELKNTNTPSGISHLFFDGFKEKKKINESSISFRSRFTRKH